MRDYNTGRYRHYGLEARYAAQAIDEGLHQCHVRVFEELVALPLKEQTEDLLNFFESLKEDKARLVGVWRRLRSYRILPLEDCYPLARELVRTLGTILESEHYPIKDRLEQSDRSRAVQRGEPDSVCEVQTL